MCATESEEPDFQSEYFIVLILWDFISLFFKMSYDQTLKLIESVQEHMENDLVSSVLMYCINLIFTLSPSCFSLPPLYNTCEHGSQNVLQIEFNNISYNLMQSETAPILSPVYLKFNVYNSVIEKKQHKQGRRQNKWFFFFVFCLFG